MGYNAIYRTSLLALLLLVNCSTQPTPRHTSFPLIDERGIKHRYRGNINDFIFPTHKRKLTKYCTIHFHWEHIKAVWSKDKLHPGQYRWNYRVKKDKKSFKKGRR